MYLFRGQTSSVLGYRTEDAIRLILPISEESSEFFLYLKIGMFSLYSSLTGVEIVTETVFDVFLDAYIHALHSMVILLRNMDESYDEERMRYQKAMELASTAQRDLRLANIRRDQSELKKETLAMDALNTLSKRYDMCFSFMFIRDADLSVNMLPNHNAKYLMWDKYVAQREYLMSI